MTAYYNEFDPFAAAWLRELIKDGLIADGVVDERSITDIKASDLKGFDQCHFFAGIGGWSHALRLAGWPDDRPVWTGSPPCQPFSVAGNRKGKDDERHLWPVFFELINKCQPPTVFGEQVASAIRDGWFDDLQADMERENYACGMVVLPACSVGAPHKRDRLWFVADSRDKGLQRHWRSKQVECKEGRKESPGHGAKGGINNSPLAQSNIINGRSIEEPGQQAGDQRGQSNGNSSSDGNTRVDCHSTLGNAEHDGPHGIEIGRSTTETGNGSTQGQDVPSELEGTSRSEVSGDLCFWEDSRFIYCRDNKYRPIPVEPALFPLADGIPNRVGILRGAGNAIVPQAAAEVIKSFMEIENERSNDDRIDLA